MIIKQISKGMERKGGKLRRRHITKSDCLWVKRLEDALGISIRGAYDYKTTWHLMWLDAVFP